MSSNLMRPVAVAAMLLSFSAHAFDVTDVLRRIPRGQARDLVDVIGTLQSVTQAASAPRDDDVATDGERVVFYSTAWCGYCTRARNHMRAQRVPFVEYDIEKSSRARDDYRAAGGTGGVPLLLIGRQKLAGFDAGRFDRLYAEFRAESAQTATAGPGADAQSIGAPAKAGGVLQARIANVPLYALPEATSAVVVQLKKGEEVVALGEESGMRIKVQSAQGSGWADKALLKP
jgi:glutaredoxin